MATPTEDGGLLLTPREVQALKICLKDIRHEFHNLNPSEVKGYASQCLDIIDPKKKP